VRVEQANGAARVQPSRAGYLNAIQVYPFSDGALYQIYSAPGEITDVALEPGEQLVGSGPVAAGDTVRWIIGDTESGTGPAIGINASLEGRTKSIPASAFRFAGSSATTSSAVKRRGEPDSASVSVVAGWCLAENMKGSLSRPSS
jgi:hypothetical protein